MNTTTDNEAFPADPLSQDLYEIELRIARRADELAKTVAPVQDRNFEYWLRAEREVLGG